MGLNFKDTERQTDKREEEEESTRQYLRKEMFSSRNSNIGHFRKIHIREKIGKFPINHFKIHFVKRWFLRIFLK